MSLTSAEREQVATELKQFARDLNLTEEQKEKFHAALAEGREKIDEYVKKNPNTTRADIIGKVKARRTEIRERVEKFLNPEQLSKWDAEVAKAKEFLGQRLDAA
jgi:Spy/CpxP family protein refolding chaperone